MLIRLLFSLIVSCMLASPASAFTCTIIDNFNRANEGPPPSASWSSNPEVGEATTLRVIDNAADPSASAFGAAYWNAATFGPDIEVCVTAKNTAGISGGPVVYGRMQQIGNGTTDSYFVVRVNATTIDIRRMDNEVETTLGASITQANDDDDAIGLSTIGDQICAHFNNDGAGWTQLGCRTDATYNSAGNVALGINSTAGTPGEADDFGARTVAAAPTRRPIAPVIFSRLADILRFAFTFLELSHAHAQ